MSLFGQVVDATTGEVLREATRGDWARAREARRLGVDGLLDGRAVRVVGPAEDPERFDHDAHLRKLEEAEATLRGIGHHALAGAVSRAAALHRDMRGRVAHAAHAMRQLDLARRHLVSTPTTTACLPLALGRVSKARGLLDNYVAKREAPWIEPTPVLFPEVDALVAGRSGLDEGEEVER